MTWMVTISYLHCQSVRLRLAGHCQFDVVQYYVVTAVRLLHTAVVFRMQSFNFILLQTKPNEVLAIGHLAHRGSLLRRLYPQGSFECELIMGKFGTKLYVRCCS